jgi:hypothetical protein
MEILKRVESFKHFILLHGLPANDVALFGVRCPYCGKSDRVRELEVPDTLRTILSAEELETYGTFWVQLSKNGHNLAICKFCHNPLHLDPDANTAEPLLD